MTAQAREGRPSRVGRAWRSFRTEQRWLVPVAALLAKPLIRLLRATYRVEVVAGESVLEGRMREGSPAVYAFWHNRLFLCGWEVYERTRRENRQLGFLISSSRDGEVMSRMAANEPLRVARGSTSRGGLSGLHRLHRFLAREGLSVMLALDGPRGPIYACQPGVFALAQAARAPIVPMSYAASRCWRLGSWDRMVLPKPFARIKIAVGEPLEVPRDIDPEGGPERLRRELSELWETAEEALRG